MWYLYARIYNRKNKWDTLVFFQGTKESNMWFMNTFSIWIKKWCYHTQKKKKICRKAGELFDCQMSPAPDSQIFLKRLNVLNVEDLKLKFDDGDLETFHLLLKVSPVWEAAWGWLGCCNCNWFWQERPKNLTQCLMLLVARIIVLLELQLSQIMDWYQRPVGNLSVLGGSQAVTRLETEARHKVGRSVSEVKRLCCCL